MMKINDKEIQKIVVTGKDGEVLVVITDTEIVEHKGIKVVIDSD